MEKPYIFNKSSLFLKRNSPRKKYNPDIENHKKSIVVWKSRRLLLSYIQFLVFNLTEINNISVFIITSGECYHINIIIEMFPKINFIILHFGKKKHQITKTKSIYQISDFEKLVEWKNINNIKCYLISDYTIKGKGYLQEEKGNKEALLQQQKWLFQLNPVAASLLFRLPYPSKTTTSFSYLSGTCFFIPYSNKFSTETRLEPYKENDVFIINNWDLREYEEMMFHHNLITRQQYRYYNILFKNLEENINSKELDNYFDSTLEVFILYSWFQFLNLSKKNIEQQLTKLVDKISLMLSPVGKSADTHLSKREIVKEEFKKEDIDKKKKDDREKINWIKNLENRDNDLFLLFDNENRKIQLQKQGGQNQERRNLKKISSIPLPQGKEIKHDIYFKISSQSVPYFILPFTSSISLL